MSTTPDAAPDGASGTAGARRGDSRTAIRTAAERLFAERGYAATSVRDIAAAAAVDPALVIRHFTGKEPLFLATMQLDLELEAVLDGPIESLGPRLIAYLLDADEHTRGVFLALLRASDTDDVSTRLREVHDAGFVEPLRRRLTGADRDLRASLAGALVGGLLYALWVVGDERLLAADHADLARHYGRVLQDLITPA
ncbi:TetR family transcriptional regulator [Tersicoccus sp. MR15.9]|uniref:TetR/AcrR family transcriptional regulator n=1 Tax=Tersicoccus mangrovi TaxID=3121635 RepID=UPI002FE51F7B